VKTPTEQSNRGRQALWAYAFWVYFTVLSVLLLWPKLELPQVIERPDLWAHGGSFGLFTLLLCLWNPLRVRGPGLTGLMGMAGGVAYGGSTELLQMIPFVKRTAGWDDWAADSFGALCGLIAFMMIYKLTARYAPARQPADS
jgi:VanZ family protein